MSPLLATLATLLIFFAPGLLIVAALRGEKRSELTLVEELYLALAASLVVSGWVGLALAELGRFSPSRVALALAVFLVALAVAFRKRLALGRGRFDGREFLFAGAVVAFSLVAYFPPFEYILGGRDPGIYVNTGFHLAREGNLTFVDPVIASVPSEDRALFFRVDKEIPDWSHLRFQGYQLENPDTARVVPHGLHLYPTWIGTAAALYEMKAGLYATPFFALLGALGWFFALKRLFGLEVAVWAGAILTVFQIQTWFARFPNSEVVVQALYACALFGFYFMEEKGSRVAGLLSGMALGSTLLARMENVLFLVPIALYLGFKRMTRSFGAPQAAFLAGFGALALHGALHDRFVSWPYVSSILGRHYWRMLGDNLVLVAVLGAAALVAADWLSRKLPASTFDFLQSDKLRLGAAVALFALAAFTYFVRPFWHGPRTAPHDAEAFFRMGWYLYPVGLALAVSGAMVLLVRARRSQVFFLLTGLTFSLFFFYKVRVWHDHYFAMRRFIPVILPSLIACLSIFLVSLRSGSTSLLRHGSRVVAAALLLVYLNDGRALWAFRGHEEFPGSLDFVEDLARHIGDEDVVIFPRREGLHMLELPLAELHGKKVLEFYSLKPPRAELEDLLAQWRDDYRDVYFITNYKISLSGLFTRHVKDFWFATEKYEYSYQSPPSGAEPFHLRFTLSKAVDLDDLAERVPQLPELDVGGSDDLQVSWFHEKELDENGRSYRWSQRISTIYLPAVGAKNTSIEVTLAGAEEPEAPRRPVRLAIDGYELGELTPGPEFETHRLELPPEIRARTSAAPALLTLETPTWRPHNVIPGASDVRDLGVRLDLVSLR